MSNKRGKMLEYVRAGRTLDYLPVIDFHTHLGKACGHYYIPENATDKVVATMDRIGINHIVTFTIGVNTDVETGNEYQYNAVKQHPDRISALSMLHAGYPQDWLPILKNGHENNSRGIKLISAYQAAGSETGIDWSQAFDYARGKNWVILNHNWGSHDRLRDYAKNFPDVTFIIGHGDRGNGALIREFDNVYQCTCASFVVCYCASIVELYNTVPLEKILYGSDCLDLDFGTAIGSLAYADIPEPAKEKIIGGNALQLIQKLQWDLPL